MILVEIAVEIDTVESPTEPGAHKQQEAGENSEIELEEPGANALPLGNMANYNTFSN